MSTILKALRKLEEEREAQQERALRDQVLEGAGARGRGPRIPVLVATGAAGAVLVMALFFVARGWWASEPDAASVDEGAARIARVAPPVESARTSDSVSRRAPQREGPPSEPARPDPPEPARAMPAPRARLAPRVTERPLRPSAPTPAPSVVREATPAAPRVAASPPEPRVAQSPPEPRVIQPRPEPRVIQPRPEPRVIQPRPEPRAVQRPSEPAVARPVVEAAPEPPKVAEAAPAEVASLEAAAPRVAVIAPATPAAATPEPAAPAPVAASPPATVARAEREPALAFTPLPTLLVKRTLWHPAPERRVAVLQVEGRDAPVELHEGDAVGDVVVQEIELSAVVFLHRGVEIRRRVGAR